MRVVRFYRVGDHLGCLSNFSPHPVMLPRQWVPSWQEGSDDDGEALISWPTTEHYFQAQKFIGQPEPVSLILRTASPAKAAAIGRDRSWTLRPGWETVKDMVMLTAIEAKAAQHPEVREALIGTGHDWLVEHTANDTYWADGGDDSGLNMLGRLWMAARNRLIAEAPADGVDDGPPPPWIAYPEYHRYDIGWRMGNGEGHIMTWGSWYDALTPDARASHQARFPTPPGDWEGYWDDQHPWLERQESSDL